MFPKLVELPLQEASVHLLTGDLLAAAGALGRQVTRWSAPIVEEVRSPAMRQWVDFLQGDLVSAERLSRQVRRAAIENHALPHGVGMIFTELVEAGLHIERGELERARAVLTDARASAEINGRPVIHTIVERWLARLATVEGDHAGAVAALAHARVVLAAPSDRVRAELTVEELRIAVALAPDDADALLPDLPDDCAAGLLRASLALRRDAPTSAAGILSDLAPRTVREQVEWELLSGLAAQHRDLDEAHAHLATALTIAQPHRYVSTVIQSGAGIGDLLRSMPTPPGLTVYVDELVASAEDYRVQLDTAPRPLPNDLLTSRQYGVLRLLSSRLTTNEIAATLYVSPNTLKTHMRTIYQKLQVNSRADAVREAHARQLL